MNRRWAWLLALPCWSTSTLAGQSPGAGWTLVRPDVARRTGVTADRHLREASGVAVSRRNPGILWTIEDSGRPAALIAMDTLGRYRGSFLLTGATNVDWEEVALGACPRGTCVYIADTGDNDERRDQVTIYRLGEPAVPSTSDSTRPFVADLPAERLDFRYPDGAHDVEAMTVLPDSTILLVSKGRSGGVHSYRIPPSQWRTSAPVVAERVDSLPIITSSTTGRLITGMALSPDGRRVMIRTYRDLLPFLLSPSGRLTPAPGMRGCDILGLEPQGEGVAWLDDRELVLTSEWGLFPAGSVWIIRCAASWRGNR